MELPEHLIRALQKAYRADFGRDLSHDEARALGSGLLAVLGPVFLKPPEVVKGDECRTSRAPAHLLKSVEHVLKHVRRYYEYLEESPKGTFSFEGIDVLHFHLRGRKIVAHLRVNKKKGAVYDPDVSEDLSSLLTALARKSFYQRSN